MKGAYPIVVLFGCASSALAMQDRPLEGLTPELFDSMQTLAVRTIERKDVEVRPAVFRPNANSIVVTPPMVVFGASFNDDRRPKANEGYASLFRHLLNVEVVKQNPYPGANANRWTADVTKTASFEEGPLLLAKLDLKELNAKLDDRYKEVLKEYVRSAEREGKTLRFAQQYTQLSVDFVTKPDDAVIHMLSVWEYDLEKARKRNPDDLLLQSVVSPRQRNTNYAGKVYYRLTRGGKTDQDKKRIAINKSGPLELP